MWVRCKSPMFLTLRIDGKHCRGPNLRHAEQPFGGPVPCTADSPPPRPSLGIKHYFFFPCFPSAYLICTAIFWCSNCPLSICLPFPVLAQPWVIHVLIHVLLAGWRSRISYPALWQSAATQHCPLWLHLYLEKVSCGMHRTPETAPQNYFVEKSLSFLFFFLF